MSGGGLWNDYGACELEYHDTLLLACQQHRRVADFKSKNDTQKVAPHILSNTSLLAQLAFVPFPLASSLVICGTVTRMSGNTSIYYHGTNQSTYVNIYAQIIGTCIAKKYVFVRMYLCIDAFTMLQHLCRSYIDIGIRLYPLLVFVVNTMDFFQKDVGSVQPFCSLLQRLLHGPTGKNVLWYCEEQKPIW